MHELRQLALSCLPEGTCLRTSRRNGLYAAYGIHPTDQLAQAGFRAQKEGDWLIIGLTPALLPFIKKHLPPPRHDFFLAQLERLSAMKDALEFLLTAENDEQGRILKSAVIEDICAAVVKELKAQLASRA